MLKDYIVTISLWGGDKHIKEQVSAQNTDKAKVKAKESVYRRTKIPFGMIEALSVEIKK
jgi:hypothetical protein